MVAKIPKTLLVHYEQIMAGNRRELANGAVIREGGRDSFAGRDLETMGRLLKPEMASAWGNIEKTIGAEWLPRVFDALWIANLDFNVARNSGQKNRKTSIAAKFKQIEAAVTKLKKLLDEFHYLAVPAGFGPARNPDVWPDSPALRRELDRCKEFNPENMRSELFVDAALDARESARVYLRALVTKLDEIRFPFGENRTPSNALIDLADIAADAGGSIDYDSFYAVLQPNKKKRRE